jgi:hypothetical protein
MNSSVPTSSQGLDEWLADPEGVLGGLADLELKGALSAVKVAALNVELDAIPDDLPNQAWHGRVHRQDYHRHDGQDSTSGGRGVLSTIGA